MGKKEVIEFKITKEFPLLEFLYQNVKGKSKNVIKSLLKNGQVTVNNKKETQFNLKLKINDIVKVSLKKKRVELPFPIIYEDDSMIIINKPAGLLTIATDKEKEKTAYHIIRNYLQEKNETAFIVHRLDRDTSGILLFAKNEKMKMMLQKHWNTITLKRGYIAIIEGNIKPDSGTIRSYLKEEKNTFVHSTKNVMEGKLAITQYETKQKNNDYSMLEVFLETGRKNQIRVHMSESGHPIVGDTKYQSKTDPLHRLGLHSHLLKIVHPFSKKVMTIETEIPKEFNNLFKENK